MVCQQFSRIYDLHIFIFQLNDAVTAVRGSDISSLCEKGIYYIELEQPDQQLNLKLNPAAPKNSTCSHHHLVLSRLLCPVKYLAEFDADPAEWVDQYSWSSAHTTLDFRENYVTTKFV